MRSNRGIEARHTFEFLLLPQFSMRAFNSAVELLRAANRLSGESLYAWRTLTTDGQPIHSSSRMHLLPDGALGDSERPDFLIVVAGLAVQNLRDSSVIATLRRLARSGCRLGALSTGSYLLARAGLSTRQLERLFRRYLGRTPTRYYPELRLHRARALLTQTSMSILNVALARGFVSASHFSKCYRELLHKMAREERQQAEHGSPQVTPLETAARSR